MLRCLDVVRLDVILKMVVRKNYSTYRSCRKGKRLVFFLLNGI